MNNIDLKGHVAVVTGGAQDPIPEPLKRRRDRQLRVGPDGFHARRDTAERVRHSAADGMAARRVSI